MKKIQITFLLIISFLSLDCTEKNREPLKIEDSSKIYSKKAVELINDLIESDMNFCNCILINIKSTLYIQDFLTETEYKKYLYKNLDLSVETDYQNLIGFKEELEIDSNLLNDEIKLVSRKEYDLIFKNNEIKKAREIIHEKYPNLCYMSKPIFNKDFKVGLTDLNIGGCLVRTSKVRFFDGKWKFD